MGEKMYQVSLRAKRLNPTQLFKIAGVVHDMIDAAGGKMRWMYGDWQGDEVPFEIEIEEVGPEVTALVVVAIDTLAKAQGGIVASGVRSAKAF